MDRLEELKKEIELLEKIVALQKELNLLKAPQQTIIYLQPQPTVYVPLQYQYQPQPQPQPYWGGGTITTGSSTGTLYPTINAT